MAGPDAVEVPISSEFLDQILRTAGTNVVLVGGQALAFWAAYYDLPIAQATVTKDADFLGQRSDVTRFAKDLGGRAAYPHKMQAWATSLVGCVDIAIEGNNYVHIDVLFQIHGKQSTADVWERAAEVETKGITIKIMHPMDVLESRLDNVYGLREKQDEHGSAQNAAFR